MKLFTLLFLTALSTWAGMPRPGAYASTKAFETDTFHHLDLYLTDTSIEVTAYGAWTKHVGPFHYTFARDTLFTGDIYNPWATFEAVDSVNVVVTLKDAALHFLTWHAVRTGPYYPDPNPNPVKPLKTKNPFTRSRFGLVLYRIDGRLL